MIDEDDVQTDEAIAPRPVNKVIQPTQSEREQHNLTHLPFRDWCEDCIKGKANERNFTSVEHKPNFLPCFHADYMFMGEGETDGTTPILTLKDDEQYSVFANVVPNKGVNDFTQNQLLEDIDTTGITDLIFKTDSESPIVAVQDVIKASRSHKTILENSIKGQSKTNGFIENANKFIASQIRTLRSALQRNLQCVIDRNHMVITWLVRYAATLITVYHVGKDGKTAYQRRKGKTMRQPLVDFCEKVMCKPLSNKHDKQNKLDEKFYDGIYLGFIQRNGEYIIGTEEGIDRARTIRRHTPDKQWDPEFVNKIKGVPWDLKGEAETHIKMAPEFDDEAIARIESKPAPIAPQVRRFKIYPRDFKDIGFTPKCLGCNALRNGTPNPGHNEECRQRVMEHLETTATGRDRLEREKHRTYVIISRMIEQQDKQQQKQQDMHDQQDNKRQKRQHEQIEQQEQQTPSSASSQSGLNSSLKRTAQAEG